MVKVFHIHLPARTLLLGVSEACLAVALLLAAVTASRGQAWVWLRYENGFLRVGAAACILLLCMYYYELYDSLVLRSLRQALTRLPEVLGTSCLLLAGLYLVAPGFRLRLATVLLGLALAGLGIAVVRRVYLAITRSPRLAERFVLVGDGPLARALVREITGRQELGIRLVGQWTGDAVAAASDSEADHLADVLARERSTGVILAATSRSERWLAPPGSADRQKVQVLDGANFYEVITGKLWLDSLNSSRFPVSRAVNVSPLLLAGKSLASFVLSLLALVVTAPLMALVAAAIVVDSGRPVIFRQQRVGRHGRTFTLYKFRSMHNGDHGGFRPAQENDARFTCVGRWLRRTRFDELPQLWNILRGDMAFVGPRPFACEEEWQLARDLPFYTQRWCVKPGATGWAQVHRAYCATPEDNLEKLAYDLFYIKNLSLGLDLIILLQTTKILLHRQGAR
jgi:exopolysaccharide biosynthesis polyprenyl glycosylphosphotransferase